MSSREIKIIGAGFSGLSLAYYLLQKNPTLKITILEKNAEVGGLLQTEKTPFGIVEKAANALLDSPQLREMTANLGLELISAKQNLKKAYFLRDEKLRAWPLSLLESVYFLCKIIVSFFNLQKLLPQKNETILQWGQTHLGEKATAYIIDPALAGIYAAPLEELSASLILTRFFAKKDKTKKKKLLSVAPKEGMQELIKSLQRYLEAKGVTIKFNARFTLAERVSSVDESYLVFCGSLGAAQRFLGEQFSGEAFASLKMLPITTTTVFFEKASKYQSFGVLFPRSEERPFLGALLNSQIFSERGARDHQNNSETWIRSDMVEESRVKSELCAERKKFFNDTEEPLHTQITMWPEALPLYNLELEDFLVNQWGTLKEKIHARRIYLHGNYLGKLGLSQILLRSQELATEIEAEVVRERR